MVVFTIPLPEKEANLELDGIGRVSYLISIIGIFVLTAIAGEVVNVAWAICQSSIMLLFPSLLRLKNLQWSPVLLALAIAPGINLILIAVLTIFPEDYAITKKLDLQAILTLCIALIFGFLVLLFGGVIVWASWQSARPITIR